MTLFRNVMYCLALCLAPLHAALADTVDLARESITAEMAAYPDDAEIQDRGRRALEALEAWKATLESRIETGRDALLAGQEGPAATVAIGPAVIPNPMEGLDSWDINENWIGAAVVQQAWTVDNRFRGTRGFVTGRYSFHRSEVEREVSDCDCNPPPPAPYLMIGTLFGSVQWGDQDLERAYLGATAYSLQRNFVPVPGAWKPLRDTLELGVAYHGMDDPLGIDSYTEITAARAGRTWGWIPRNKNFVVMAGLGLSGGWAWAESAEPDFNDVSNPIIGTWVTLGVAWPDWGKVYVEQRQINGFQFSSPSAGGSTSREARFRAGFIKQFTSCLSLELFVDKRSFNFSDHRKADLYTKARRAGLEMGCSW